MSPLLESSERTLWSSGGNGALVTVQKFYNITGTDTYLGKNTIYSKANFFLTNKNLIVCGDHGNQMSFELSKIATKWLTGNGKEYFNFSYDRGVVQEKYQFMSASTFVARTDAQILLELCPVNPQDTADTSLAIDVFSEDLQEQIVMENEIKNESTDPELEELRARKSRLREKLRDKKEREKAEKEEERKLELARKFERQLDYDQALVLYRELDSVEDIRRVNKRKMEARTGVPTTIVQGNYIDDRDTATTYIDDRDTILKDSVVSRSNIGSEGYSGSLQIKIDQLKELHDDGLISNEIYEERMQKLTIIK